ncbi:MAG TPA: hypothetical protein VE467_04905, partial [Chryseolinea sp.]|nr:hypothetical protein [Chryseolinea sp.]
FLFFNIHPEVLSKPLLVVFSYQFRSDSPVSWTFHSDKNIFDDLQSNLCELVRHPSPGNR